MHHMCMNFEHHVTGSELDLDWLVAQSDVECSILAFFFLKLPVCISYFPANKESSSLAIYSIESMEQQ